LKIFSFYLIFSFFIDFKNRLFQACGMDTLIDRLENIHKKVNECQELKGTLTSSSFLYRRYIDKLKDNSCCPLCRRNFNAYDEVQELMQEVTPILLSSVDVFILCCHLHFPFFSSSTPELTKCRAN